MSDKKKRMKLIKSTIKRDKPIGELPHGKVTITMGGINKKNVKGRNIFAYMKPLTYLCSVN